MVACTRTWSSARSDPNGESSERVSYTQWRGSGLGATVWRSVSEENTTRVLPDASMDLMWFDEQLVVAGPDTHAIAFDRSRGNTTWGLRLAPGIAHALLGISADELANSRVPLSDLVGVDVPSDAFAGDIGRALEATLLSLYQRADPDRSMLALARAIDAAARLGLSARDASAAHGISERSLRRIAVRWFGYGYKTLAQIHRFQQALRSAQTGSSMAQAASVAGYADQAHFTRECRRFSGLTPSGLITER